MAFSRRFVPSFGLLLFLLLGLAPPFEARADVWRDIQGKWSRLTFLPNFCTVAVVVDGDTVHVDCKGKREKLRLVGIDTPETKHPFKPVEYFGPEASARAKQLMPQGMQLRLAYETEASKDGEVPRDRYKRLLVYIFFLNGKMFNEQMVREGYAFSMQRYPHPYMREFTQLEEEAKSAKRGMWVNPQRVKQMQDEDDKYRQQGKTCRQKAGNRFQWVIGDTFCKLFFLKRHRAYFKTDPALRVLFCSPQEAEDIGYTRAPDSYYPFSRDGRRQACPDGRRPPVSASSSSGSSESDGSSRSSESPPEHRSMADDPKPRPRDEVEPRSRDEAEPPSRPVTSGSLAAPLADLSEAKARCKTDEPVVGNKRSKMFRVPLQSGYKKALKSKNAVFFCTEEQATALSYKPSKAKIRSGKRGKGGKRGKRGKRKKKDSEDEE